MRTALSHLHNLPAVIDGEPDHEKRNTAMRSSLNIQSKLALRWARVICVVCASLLLAVISISPLRGVSADALGKFSLSAQSRVGQLIKRIRPSAATKVAVSAAPFITRTV